MTWRQQRAAEPVILVTAANGNQGRLLIPRLLAAEHTLRACVHSDASAQVLRAAGVTDIVVGDISDPDVLAQAMHGVTVQVSQRFEAACLLITGIPDGRPGGWARVKREVTDGGLKGACGDSTSGNCQQRKPLSANPFLAVPSERCSYSPAVESRIGRSPTAARRAASLTRHPCCTGSRLEGKAQDWTVTNLTTAAAA